MKIIPIFTLALLMTIPVSLFAVEKRYVSDSLWLQLRSGPGQEFRILKALQSGEHLVLLEEDVEKQYSRVKTPKGLEGWVLTRFLENEPIAKEKLILANRRLADLAAELKTLKEQKEKTQKELSELKKDHSSLNRDTQSLTKELEHIKEVSAGALELDSKYKKLSTRNQELKIQMQALDAENVQLKDNRQQNYMIYGGGLVLIGLLLGLVVPPMLNNKRNNSDWV